MKKLEIHILYVLWVLLTTVYIISIIGWVVFLIKDKEGNSEWNNIGNELFRKVWSK